MPTTLQNKLLDSAGLAQVLDSEARKRKQVKTALQAGITSNQQSLQAVSDRVGTQETTTAQIQSNVQQLDLNKISWPETTSENTVVDPDTQEETTETIKSKDQGTSGQVLKTNGTGGVYWGDALTTAVTSITMTPALSSGTAIGTIQTITGSTTTSATFYTPTVTLPSVFSQGVAGLVPAPSASDATKFLQGDGTWVAPAEIGVFSSSANGMVPAPGQNNDGKFLGTTGWATVTTPTNTPNNLQFDITGKGTVNWSGSQQIKVSVRDISVTVPASNNEETSAWTQEENSETYYQTVQNIDYIDGDVNFMVDVDYTNCLTSQECKDMLEAYAKIGRVEGQTNALKFTCYDGAPEQDVDVRIRIFAVEETQGA